MEMKGKACYPLRSSQGSTKRLRLLATKMIGGNLGSNHIHLKEFMPSKFAFKKVCRVLNEFGKPSDSIVEENRFAEITVPNNSMVAKCPLEN